MLTIKEVLKKKPKPVEDQSANHAVIHVGKKSLAVSFNRVDASGGNKGFQLHIQVRI
jgi:hypothetical protein